MPDESNNIVRIKLPGRIDADNISAVKQEIWEQLDVEDMDGILLDAGDLSYISSAGLRMLIQMNKEFKNITITGAAPEIYEIFDMTGFTEMMTVERGYRRVSVEGCEVVGV